jgi:hypothetical protein
MTWEVKSCRQYAKGTDHPAWRVQRWCQDGQQGAYEMAFVHEDKRLVDIIADVLNAWYDGGTIQIDVRLPSDDPRLYRE